MCLGGVALLGQDLLQGRTQQRRGLFPGFLCCVESFLRKAVDLEGGKKAPEEESPMD